MGRQRSSGALPTAPPTMPTSPTAPAFPLSSSASPPVSTAPPPIPASGLSARPISSSERHSILGGLKLDGAIFYSDVSDVIASVILPAPAPAGTTQSQNVGQGTYYGLEAAVSGMIRDDLEGGVNYTFQARRIRIPANVAPLQLTGVPGTRLSPICPGPHRPTLPSRPTCNWPPIAGQSPPTARPITRPVLSRCWVFPSMPALPIVSMSISACAT
jgi:hypothetical protein